MSKICTHRAFTVTVALMANEPKEKGETSRFQTMLDAQTIRYLEALAGKGTHGSSVPAVGRKLIEEGVRTAIKEGFIKLRD